MKKTFLDLLKQPITNSYLTDINKKSIKEEYFYNLSVVFDTNNYLVSLSKPVDPKKQYTDKYAHRASQSLTMRESFKKIAKKLKLRFKPNSSMEIGSNDGVFIKNFKKKRNNCSRAVCKFGKNYKENGLSNICKILGCKTC